MTHLLFESDPLTCDAKCRALIDAIRETRALWDHTYPEYHNSRLKAMLWKNLSKRLGLERVSGHAIFRKWMSFRRGYATAKHASRLSGRRPSYKFFDDLRFLDDPRQREPKSSTVKLEEEGESGVAESVVAVVNNEHVAVVNNNEKVVAVEEGVQNDEEGPEYDADYLYLMKLLPDMKKIPYANRMRLKITMRDIVHSELIRPGSGHNTY